MVRSLCLRIQEDMVNLFNFWSWWRRISAPQAIGEKTVTALTPWASFNLEFRLQCNLMFELGEPEISF